MTKPSDNIDISKIILGEEQLPCDSEVLQYLVKRATYVRQEGDNLTSEIQNIQKVLADKNASVLQLQGQLRAYAQDIKNWIDRELTDERKRSDEQ